jgi:hypothetical protein
MRRLFLAIGIMIVTSADAFAGLEGACPLTPAQDGRSVRDLHTRTAAQHAPALDATSVDEGAVHASQIFDRPHPRVFDDARVPARNGRRWDVDVVVARPPDRDHPS